MKPLARMRLLKGWSQTEMGRRVGVKGPQVCRWELGLALPKGQNLIRYAEALDISPGDLLDIMTSQDTDEALAP